MPHALTPLEKRLAAFGPALIALFLGVALLAAIGRAGVSRERVTRSQQVIETLDNTLVRLVDAETGARGYLLTGDTSYLAPFTHAESDVRAGIATLRAQTLDHPVQQRRVDSLVAFTATRFALLDSAVVRVRAGLVVPRPTPPVNRRGKEAMDGARRVIRAMENEERRLLAARERVDDSRARLLVLLAAAGSALAAVLALIGNGVLTRYATALERTSQQAQRARQAADDARARFTSILDSLSDATAALDREYRVVYLNPAAQVALRALGVDPPATIGQVVWQIIPGSADTRFQREIVAAVDGQRSVEFEEFFEPAQGWFEVRVFPFPDGVVTYARNVTERRRATERLARLTALLEEAERNAHLGSWEWDIPRDVITWSKEMYRIYGRDPVLPPPRYEEFIALVHPDDRARVDAAVRRSVETQQPFVFDHRIVRADGAERTLHAAGRVLPDTAGRPSRMVGSGLDITERVLAEAERERLVAELSAANRVKMQFLAAMSHELRTPLNAIDGYAELVAMGIRGPVTSEQRADLERIRRNGRYLLSLINDILNFAKLEAGQVEIHLADVPVDETLAGLEALIAPQIAAKGVHYRYVPCPRELTVRADGEKLQQVVLNLVSNAVKYTDAGGTVTLRCDVDDAAVRVHIADTGRGIPGDKLDAIFDPFVQVERTLTTAGSQQGVGLGLAISRDLVQQMGGELSVESTVGVGSTFTVIMPRGASRGAPHDHAVTTARQAR